MGNVQRLLLQVGTALALIYLGMWIYRNPRKTLSLYGDLANHSLLQKLVTVLGTLCMFVGAYAVVVVSVGQSLSDSTAGLIAAATGIAVVWGVKKVSPPQSR